MRNRRSRKHHVVWENASKNKKIKGGGVATVEHYRNNIAGLISDLYEALTHRMYMMTPMDHISHDLSYFSGPRTSGAEIRLKYLNPFLYNKYQFKKKKSKIF